MSLGELTPNQSSPLAVFFRRRLSKLVATTSAWSACCSQDGIVSSFEHSQSLPFTSPAQRVLARSVVTLGMMPEIASRLHLGRGSKTNIIANQKSQPILIANSDVLNYCSSFDAREHLMRNLLSRVRIDIMRRRKSGVGLEALSVVAPRSCLGSPFIWNLDEVCTTSQGNPQSQETQIRSPIMPIVCISKCEITRVGSSVSSTPFLQPKLQSPSHRTTKRPSSHPSTKTNTRFRGRHTPTWYTAQTCARPSPPRPATSYSPSSTGPCSGSPCKSSARQSSSSVSSPSYISAGPDRGRSTAR